MFRSRPWPSPNGLAPAVVVPRFPPPGVTFFGSGPFRIQACGNPSGISQFVEEVAPGCRASRRASPWFSGVACGRWSRDLRSTGSGQPIRQVPRQQVCIDRRCSRCGGTNDLSFLWTIGPRTGKHVGFRNISIDGATTAALPRTRGGFGALWAACPDLARTIPMACLGRPFALRYARIGDLGGSGSRLAPCARLNMRICLPATVPGPPCFHGKA